jgi:hypothetical protein
VHHNEIQLNNSQHSQSFLIKSNHKIIIKRNRKIKNTLKEVVKQVAKSRVHKQVLKLKLLNESRILISIHNDSK